MLNSSFWDKEDSKFRLNNYNGLSQDFKNDDRKLTSQIIQFAVEFPEAEIAERLQVEVTAPVYKIIRLRLLDEKPYVLEHTYMAISQLKSQMNMTKTIWLAKRQIRFCRWSKLFIWKLDVRLNILEVVIALTREGILF